MQLFIYTSDPTLLETINSSSELSDLIGDTWADLPYAQREIRPNLVYEIDLTIPNEFSFSTMTEILDRMTDGTCLVIQAQE